MEVGSLSEEVDIPLSLVKHAQITQSIDVVDEVPIVAGLGMQVEGDKLIVAQVCGRVALLCDGFNPRTQCLRLLLSIEDVVEMA